MSTAIIASNIPQTVTKDKVQEFFSFCGKIDSIEEEKGTATTNTYRVTFFSTSAVSTALLLNGAELGGSPVTVSADNVTTSSSQPPSYSEAPAATTATTDSKATTSTTGATQENYGQHSDIPQELKPKAAIFAQYLSKGYVLGDHLVQKAVDHDKKYGYSDKFKTFLSDLDTKYNLQDKQKDFQAKQTSFDNKYKISSSINQYFDKARQTDFGSKLHSFYTNAVNDTLQVHEEAKRLANLSLQQQPTQTATQTTSAPAYTDSPQTTTPATTTSATTSTATPAAQSTSTTTAPVSTTSAAVPEAAAPVAETVSSSTYPADKKTSL